jgi:signal transduction histidine kinase
LESRVEERTQALEQANEALRKEVTERKRVEGERIELLGQLVSAQEDERRRFARDLHDQLGQQLTALRLKLE